MTEITFEEFINNSKFDFCFVKVIFEERKESMICASDVTHHLFEHFIVKYAIAQNPYTQIYEKIDSFNQNQEEHVEKGCQGYILFCKFTIDNSIRNVYGYGGTVHLCDSTKNAKVLVSSLEDLETFNKIKEEALKENTIIEKDLLCFLNNLDDEELQRARKDSLLERFNSFLNNEIELSNSDLLMLTKEIRKRITKNNGRGLF